jgi:hypothetical protein
MPGLYCDFDSNINVILTDDIDLFGFYYCKV